MEATVNATGETVSGEVKGETLCVQHGPDFDPTHTVYVLDEITLNPAPDIESIDDFPTELDNDFPDAVFREQESERCESELFSEFIRAAAAYTTAASKTLAVINDITRKRR